MHVHCEEYRKAVLFDKETKKWQRERKKRRESMLEENEYNNCKRKKITNSNTSLSVDYNTSRNLFIYLLL